MLRGLSWSGSACVPALPNILSLHLTMSLLGHRLLFCLVVHQDFFFVPFPSPCLCGSLCLDYSSLILAWLTPHLAALSSENTFFRGNIPGLLHVIRAILHFSSLPLNTICYSLLPCLFSISHASSVRAESIVFCSPLYPWCQIVLSP